MNDSQLILLLRSLDAKDVRELRKWLQSPAHNQRADVLELFEYLMGAQRLEQEKFLAKEWLFRKIFPEEDYDDAKLRQTVHFCLKAVESYLIYSRQSDDEIGSRLALATELRRRGLIKPLQRTLRQIDRLQENSPYRNEVYFRNEYLYQQEAYSYAATMRRTTETNLQEVAVALDRTYIIEKLAISCLMLFHQSMRKVEYDTSFLPGILRHVEQRGLESEPVIGIYYYTLKTITDRSRADYYEKLRSLTRRHRNLLPPYQQRDLYTMVINCCISQINAGVENFVREGFEWYRQGIEEGILIENNRLSHFTYLNAALNGIKLKEFVWVDQFLDRYKDYLPANKREPIYTLARARYYFDQGQFAESQELLLQHESDDLLLNLGAKTMLAMIFYESEEMDVLESMLDSFQVYLRRKEVMGYQRTHYQNFVRMVRRLVRVNPYDEERTQKLARMIETTTPLAERPWLLRKMENLVKA